MRWRLDAVSESRRRATWRPCSCAALLLPGAAFAQTLKVLDWNTHHGVGTDGVYDLQRFVTWIARSGAHVVSLNEVEKNNGWGDEDQPARYAALLKAATGKTWYYTFAQRDGGTNGQGNLILSTFPFEATGATTLSYSRSVARAQIVVNGVRVNIFSTHLDADSSTRRATQMDELKSWAAGYSQQHIIAGDFNAWPGAAEIANMTACAHDAWAVAKTDGTAVAYDGNSAGNTRNSRIDYVWYSKSATQLVLKAAQVFDTRDSQRRHAVGSPAGDGDVPGRLRTAPRRCHATRDDLTVISAVDAASAQRLSSGPNGSHAPAPRHAATRGGPRRRARCRATTTAMAVGHRGVPSRQRHLVRPRACAGSP